MIDKLSSNQRLILAITLSMLFFVAYEAVMNKFYPPLEQNLSMQENKQNIAMQNNNSSNLAPTTSKTNLSKSSKIEAKTIAVIKAKDFELSIDELGRISKYYLNNPKYNESRKLGGIVGMFGNDTGTKEGQRAQLIDETFSPFPLEVRFSDAKLNELAFKTPYLSSQKEIFLENEPKSIILTQNLGNEKIVKNIKFYPNGKMDVKINLSNPTEYFISQGSRPNIAVDGYTFHGILIQQSNNKLNVIDDGNVDHTEIYESANVVASVDRYYTTLLFSYQNLLTTIVSKTQDGKPDAAFIKSNQDMDFMAYIGAKDYATLNAINPRLTDVIEYGWFTFIAQPVFSLLKFIHGIFGNWGWSIIVLTLIIRIVLFPLTYKGMVSMNKLKELSPKIKDLQQKYKGEPQKLNMHMMELYKKHGANPMGGCLPILLQIPIFFAIYRVLLNAVELKDAPWILWVHDLSVMDSWFILPILMGATMYIHQRITPTNFTDPMQEKIMRYLPLIFTFFFFTFPAGLTLYWFTNNTFSILQQLYVNKIFQNHKQQEAHEKGEKA